MSETFVKEVRFRHVNSGNLLAYASVTFNVGAGVWVDNFKVMKGNEGDAWVAWPNTENKNAKSDQERFRKTSGALEIDEYRAINEEILQYYNSSDKSARNSGGGGGGGGARRQSGNTGQGSRSSSSNKKNDFFESKI